MRSVAFLLELYEEGMGLTGKCREYLEEQRVILTNQEYE
ncbi:Exodeoxyribonuclease VII small subunit [Synechococcus sp. PCC 7502]|nr:Exodeoxyribonuclease VII small subunit [Synechococcus sp. PCC 7502]